MKQIKKSSKKVNFFAKMGTKVGYLVLAMVLIPIAVLIFMSSGRTTNAMKKTYMAYAQNLAEEAAAGVNFAVEFGEKTYGTYAQNLAQTVAIGVGLVSGKTTTTDVDKLNMILGQIKLEGVESSYAYMVSPKGVMLYHPTTDKIGKPVENAAVKQIVADLESGKDVADGYTIYEYKGANKLAGYALTPDKNIVIVTADYDDFMKIDYDLLIGAIEITDVEGSYGYLVSGDGTMLFHTNAEKIGQPVENAAVKGLVADLEAGKEIKPGSVVYEYKGEDKIAGYCLTDKGNIVIVTADYNTFLKPVTSLKKELILIGIAMVVISALIGIIFVSMMMAPIGKVVPEIQNTANFDFKKNPATAKLARRKDEIGVIAREVSIMRESLSKMVGRIGFASESIDANVDELLEVSQSVNDMCADNSATSEELAAGMQETSASTTTIAANIGEIKNNAKDIVKLANDGAELSTEVKNRAAELHKSTENATSNTMQIYTDVKEKSTVAMKASESVEKINALTETVMAISAQTSLLALNASIEAARAGEAGRGFSVVATEIGNLATQTTSAVNSINSIVAEVNSAVGGMTECLSDIINFLETKVIDDYKNFGNVSVQYQNDASDFGNSMNQIKTQIDSLNETLEVIVDSISAINSTMGEAASGVSDIAGKTSDMVAGTSTTADKVDECKKYVADLNAIISTFKLDE